MAFCHRSGERKRITHDFRRQEEEVVGSLCRLGSRPISPKSLMEQEKRIRREIANSNERRRMQSINAGFQSLRTLLPHREGEKLSKAAILQNTADYIYQLEQEKARLLEQNSQLKRRVLNSQSSQDSDGSCSDSPLPKRKKGDAGYFWEDGTGSSSPARSESIVDDVKRELVELRLALEQERNVRMTLEEQIKSLESQLIAVDAIQDQLTFQKAPEDAEKSSTISLVFDNDIRSPESRISSLETDISRETPERVLSPKLSVSEVPEDLSGKTNPVLLPCVSELSISDVNSVPGVLLPPSCLNVPSTALSVELEATTSYKHSTSRQNLETIVQAIRHVEGDYMFRDDSESPISQWTEQENIMTQSTELCKELQTQNLSFQDQIIKNAPVIQPRPGVIVSNHS